MQLFFLQICVVNKIDMIRNVSFIFGLSRDFLWNLVHGALLFILQGHSSEEVVLQSICGACPSLAAGIVQLYCASTIQILRYPPISGTSWQHQQALGTGGIQNRDKYALTHQKPKLYPLRLKVATSHLEREDRSWFKADIFSGPTVIVNTRTCSNGWSKTVEHHSRP